MTKGVAPKTWTISLVLASLGLVWFLWPQLSTVVLTALMAYLFYPLYVRLKRKKGHIAAFSTLVISFLVVLLPVAFVLITAFGQLMNFAGVASRYDNWSGVVTTFTQSIESINAVVAPLAGRSDAVTVQSVTDFLRTTLPATLQAGAQLVFGVATSLPQLGIAVLIYAFLFVEFLQYGPQLVRRIKALSPFAPEATERYFERVGLMANAMVKGQLMISMIISAVSAALLIPLGYGHYFFILFVLFTILNFIPLGCGIVLVPLAVYSMLTGQFWIGLVVLVLYYLSGNLDPVLRPHFIPKKIQLSVGLTMIATFCGIAYFGILGVVYGPIIMILLVTTFDLYEEYRQTQATGVKNKVS